MSTLRLTVTDFGGTGRPVLVLGPSIGTTVATLWAAAAAVLTGEHHVLGWDLPGHGATQAADAVTVPDLSRAVLDAVDGPFDYAGVSLGGAVGLRLLLDAPDRVRRATLLATGARIGEPPGWHERAARVRAEGTAFLVGPSRERWFGPVNRETAVADALLADLANADPTSYAALCEALAAFDVRDRLAEIAAPVTAVAGAHDPITTPATLRHVAHGVRHGRLVVVDDAAHQLPAEAPDLVARLIAATPTVDPTTVAEVRATGMRVRREVLGDAHVDQASAGADEFTTHFQDFVNLHAWGAIWTRPGLDRRSRSLITLTALVARGHHDELAMHLRAALHNGLTRDEITELVLQTAVYCGVPAANAAFRVARQVFAETGSDSG